MHKQNDIAAMVAYDRNFVPDYGRKAMQQPVPKYDLLPGELTAEQD